MKSERLSWEDKAARATRKLLSPEKIAEHQAELLAKSWPEIERIQRALAHSYARARTTPIWG